MMDINPGPMRWLAVLLATWMLLGCNIYRAHHPAGSVPEIVDRARFRAGAASISLAYSVGGHEPVAYVSADSSEVTSSSVYAAGSITKQFTAAMILRLAAAKRLKLEAALSSYVPEASLRYPGVTIRDLLMHVSGIPDYLQVRGCGPCDDLDGRSEAIRMLAISPDFSPRSRWEYSNTNYELLGIVIERVTHRAYSKNFLDLIQRLRLNGIFFGAPSDRQIPEPRRRRLFGPATITDPWAASVTGAAGAVYATPTAIAAWSQDLYTQSTVLSKKSLELFLCPCAQTGQGRTAGLGGFTSVLGGRTYYTMSGLVPGYTTEALYSPVDRIAVVAMTNEHAVNLLPLVLAVESRVLDDETAK